MNNFVCDRPEMALDWARSSIPASVLEDSKLPLSFRFITTQQDRVLTAKALLACFVPSMRYNTGFKKRGLGLAIFYGSDELRRSARAGVQLQVGW